jgi:Tripartite tricarboxylate transporter TctB family
MQQAGSSARSDILGGAGWVVFGLLVLGESLRMDRFQAMGASLYTMPGFVPGIIGSLLVLLGLCLAWRGWRRQAGERRVDGTADPLINRRLAVALPLMVIYAAALFGRVPFWLATALFVAAFTWAFAHESSQPMRRLGAAVASGVVTTAVVIFFFQEVFLVRLP